MIRNVEEPLLKEATIEAFNQLIEGHELANKQIKANIMKVIENSKGPTLDQIDQQLEEVQMKLIQTANQHQDCDALTQQIMDLRKQKEKVQSRETDQQVKLHSLDEINKLVELHKYGLVDFDEQLVRRLVEKITIFQRYMEFTFKDGEVIRVNMWKLGIFSTQLLWLGAFCINDTRRNPSPDSINSSTMNIYYTLMFNQVSLKFTNMFHIDNDQLTVMLKDSQCFTNC